MNAISSAKKLEGLPCLLINFLVECLSLGHQSMTVVIQQQIATGDITEYLTLLLFPFANARRGSPKIRASIMVWNK